MQTLKYAKVRVRTFKRLGLTVRPIKGTEKYYQPRKGGMAVIVPSK